jgi:hypothetical protein
MSNALTADFAPVSIENTNWASPAEIAQGERNAHRAQGWLIALGATTVLWAGIVGGIWAIVNAFN